ncbi:transposase [Streptomyces sp. NBC_01423]|uniref:transposase n=1 Tax=Streptomyces sp. NBC_01423 TaxID=2903860 RepID=UPI002E2CB3AB|nr:transposase [Streptomyces sp. NBC_01423]
MRAHIQLGGPIVVWGSLNTHPAARLKQYGATYDWLTTVRLPPSEPDLNPVEAVWSLLRKAMANHAFTTPDDLDRKLCGDWLERALQPSPVSDNTVDHRVALSSSRRPVQSQGSSTRVLTGSRQLRIVMPGPARVAHLVELLGLTRGLNC